MNPTLHAPKLQVAGHAIMDEHAMKNLNLALSWVDLTKILDSLIRKSKFLS